MQILIPDSWLRDYLETNATPKDIQNALNLCGPSIDRLNRIGNDWVYAIEVTTNRVDCMSVIGIAFECAAILPRFGFEAKLKQDPYSTRVNLAIQKNVDYLTVKLNQNLCPRFSAVLINSVKVGPSPDWLIKRLKLAGLRSLNTVVDISNYLMIELGQPVHTFDYDKIAGRSITVRESRPRETLTTLDNQTHTLPGQDIVIEDGSKKLIDLCGIMGGLNSAVDESTKNVLLFVQVYEPNAIRKTSMALAHRTAAAVLFEKGLPVENVLPTLNIGIDLFQELTGGQAVSEILDILNAPEGNSLLRLPTPITDFARSKLGITLEFSDIKTILESLAFVVNSETEIEVPWARKSDVLIPEDLVEEIARIYGYHNLPSQIMTGPLPTLRNDSEFYGVAKLKAALKHWGFTENYTYSLTPQDPHPHALKLKNPLSDDWTYLRTVLGPSLRHTILENLGRVPELNLFEIANVYTPRKSQLPLEVCHLAIATTRKDWFYLKGIVEGLFDYELDSRVSFTQNKDVTMYAECLIFEIDISPYITQAQKVVHYHPISKFSPIIEDVNIALTAKYDDLVNRLYKLSPLIKNIEFIDKYGDKLTLRLTYHSGTKQLSSSDISPLRQKLNQLFPG